MQITFLGTSCAKPTKERNHSAIFISVGSEGLLFDCGEGTQRQMTLAGLKQSKVTKIFVSHWHGDHVLGIPGLIQTLGLSEHEGKVIVYGPIGTIKRMEAMMSATQYDSRIEVEVKEVSDGEIYDGTDFSVEAYEIKHSVRTIGFRLIEKDRRRIKLSFTGKLGIPEGPLLGSLQDGKSITWKGKKIDPADATYVIKGKIIAYVADSIPSKNTLKIAKNADILISDSSFSEKLREKADEHKHMTARQAAEIANQANVKQLILTHFSARYKDTNELREEATEIFQNVICAEDFMKIKL